MGSLYIVGDEIPNRKDLYLSNGMVRDVWMDEDDNRVYDFTLMGKHKFDTSGLRFAGYEVYEDGKWIELNKWEEKHNRAY